MGKHIGFICVKCKKEFDKEYGPLVCNTCGTDGILNVLYDYDALKRKITHRFFLDHSLPRNHWRYRPLLPVWETTPIPPLRVGNSPLYRHDKLAAHYGFRSLLVKDDGINPTASLKDRASSIGVAMAIQSGKKKITCSSTGNAASSLAGNAASAGLHSYIFVPGNAPEGKIAQCLIFGARVFVVDGTYEQAFDLSMECVQKFGMYNRNSGINPFLVEGKKTVSFELSEQLEWMIPDYIIMSVGDGCSIAAAYKGMQEFYQLGLIDRIPRFIGVQAEGASPIYKAWKTSQDIQYQKPATLADSIAVGTPRNWRKAIDAVRKSDGLFITVSDSDILKAMKELGRATGICAEPAGVTCYAGMQILAGQGFFSHSDQVALIISGNGLKDVASVVKAAGGYQKISPNIHEVEKRIE